MEEALDTLLKKIDIVLDNQQKIYDRLAEILKETKKSPFLQNYLADVAGTITAEAGLVDVIQNLKGKKL